LAHVYPRMCGGPADGGPAPPRGLALNAPTAAVNATP
jgi:hypothetical protein